MEIQFVHLQNFLSHKDSKLNLSNRGLLLLDGINGSGKCFGADTPILMFDGSIKPVQDVVVGDKVMGPDSLPRNVLSLGRGREMLYQVIPKKGDAYIVNESHILTLRNRDRKGKYLKNHWSRVGKSDIHNISVRDYMQQSEAFKNCLGGYRAGVEFRWDRILKIDPYFLGLWLGDGNSDNPSITSMDQEIVWAIEDEAENRLLHVNHQGHWKTAPLYNITAGIESRKFLRGSKNSLINDLKFYNLLDNKHIPFDYLTSNRKDRLQLLAGLLDTDGYLSQNSGFEITTKSKKLADNILYLSRSLGFAAYAKVCRKGCQTGAVGTYNHITINGHCNEIPTRLPRKRANPRRINKDPLSVGISVESYGEGDYYGFAVDGDHRFLLGDFTVVHNSSMFDAILWCLFNKTSRGVKTDEVVRRNSGGNTHVHVRILLDNNSILDCHRYRQHKEFKNKFILLVDGKEEVSLGRDDRTTELLESYIQINYDTFSSVVLFAQGAQGFASLGDAEQKGIFEKVLSLERFAAAYERSKNLYKDISKAINDAVAEINFLEKNIVDCKGRVSQYDVLEKKFILEKEREINLLKARLGKVELNEPQLGDIEVEIGQYEQQLISCSVEDLEDIREQSQAQVNQLSIEQATYSTKLELLRQKKQGIILTDIDGCLEYSPNCPTCGQLMPDVATEHMRQSIDAQNDILRKEILQLRDEIDDADKQCRIIRKKLEEHRITLQEVYIKLEESNLIKQKLDHLRHARQNFDIDRHHWRESLDDVRREIAKAEAKDSPYTELQEKERRKLDQVIKDVEFKKMELLSSREELPYLELCEKMYSNKGLKSLILDTVTPYLNRKANEDFSELTDGKAKLKFSTQITLNSGEKRDKFNVEVNYSDGADNYIGVSGGERRKADICIILALGDLVASRSLVPIRLRLLDEIFDGLDNWACRKVVNLLHSKVDKAGTIIVMSHNNELKNYFDNVVTVRKENGISILEDDNG